MTDSSVYKGRTKPVVVLNGKALDWIFQKYFNEPRGRGGVLGFAVPSKYALEIANQATTAADIEAMNGRLANATALRQLSRTVKETMRGSKSGVAFVYNRGPHPSLTIDHELVHVGQFKYFKGGRPLPSELPRMTNHPAWNKMEQATLKRSATYKGKLTTEIPAALVSGYWKDAGMTLGEAKSMIDAYTDDLTAKFGYHAARDVMGHIQGDLRPSQLDRPIPPTWPQLLGLRLAAQAGYPPGESTQKSPAASARGRASFLPTFPPPGEGSPAQAPLPPGFVPAMVVQTPGLDNLYGLTTEQRRRLLEQFWGNRGNVA